MQIPPCRDEVRAGCRVNSCFAGRAAVEGWSVRDRKGSKTIRMDREHGPIHALSQLRPCTHMSYRMEHDWTSAYVSTGCATRFNVAVVTQFISKGSSEFCDSSVHM
ncbi:hypothetical protein NDU88_001405 [Pleurodeles waltl]|uniref:Uncharacterized protein n=1 Tax=Pleurodeles waltl TaxID=8319 RepID=A0AAV7THP0_PLEWA|nr:hypothetical protein NDU88_001405 [Pleurodeles waltl]